MQLSEVLVRCLPASIDDKELAQIFSAYGSVHSASVLGRCCTCNGSRATVCYTDLNQAERVCANSNGNVPEGLPTPIAVSLSAVRQQATPSAGPHAVGAIEGWAQPGGCFICGQLGCDCES